jgi:L-amino acid N-acyltransferase YncA
MPVRPCTLNDAPSICAIYNHYIANTVITFEELPVSVADMQQRILNIQASYPWLVYEEQEQILGYAYACKWKDRSAYKHSAEITVYLHPEHTKKGLGSILYQALIEQLVQKNIHVLLACIAIPNTASEKLHNRLGFRQVAHLREVGFKFGRWLDIGYWQKTL